MVKEQTKKYIPYFLDFFPRVLLISVPARMRVQFEGGNKTRAGSISARQRMQSRVLARMRYAMTRGPRCCQQRARLSQPRSLLPRQLPSLQAFQCTRLPSVPPCELCDQTLAPGAPPTLCEFHYCAGIIRGWG